MPRGFTPDLHGLYKMTNGLLRKHPFHKINLENSITAKRLHVTVDQLAELQDELSEVGVIRVIRGIDRTTYEYRLRDQTYDTSRTDIRTIEICG